MSKTREMQKRNARVMSHRKYGWPVEIKRSKDGTYYGLPNGLTPKVVETLAETVQNHKRIEAPQTKGTTITPGGRGVCPVCHKSEKVRKDGSMGKHGECSGQGQFAL